MCEDKGMGESASFVSGSSTFQKYKLEKISESLQSHFFLLYLHP